MGFSRLKKKERSKMDLPETVMFKNPAKINAGFNALETIPMELTWRGSSRPLLLLDSTSKSVNKKIVNSFKGSQMALLIYPMDIQESITDAVIKLIHSYKANGCDAIIASGPPMLLDVARLLNLAVSQDNSTTLDKLVVTDHLRPLVAVISDSGQALHLTESVTTEGRCFEAIGIMPSLVIIDDRLTAGIKWQSTLSNALAALTLATETLAFGQAGHFGQVYAHSALKAIVTHLAPVLLKPKLRPSKTSLLAAELSAGLSAGTRSCHPSWVLASQIAAQTSLENGLVAALVLPSALEQAKTLSSGRPDMLLTALGGNDYYCMVSTQKRDPWDATHEYLNKLLNHLRSIKPGCLPQNLHRSGLGIDRLDALATHAAEKLDKLWDVTALGRILKHTVLIQSTAVA
jgi:alcohol dehydrogenase class IV